MTFRRETLPVKGGFDSHKPLTTNSSQGLSPTGMTWLLPPFGVLVARPPCAGGASFESKVEGTFLLTLMLMVA